MNTTGISTFLISEFDSGRRGNTLDDAHLYFIPRIIWKDKPIMTSKGNALSDLYWGQPYSSLAPTYSAELYWNFGWHGIILGSIIIGIVIGVFSKLAISFLDGKYYLYLLIAIPVIIYSLWVESWLGSTYIGGLVNILQLLIIFYIIKKSIFYLNKIFYSFRTNK
jgi:hypothetical protein